MGRLSLGFYDGKERFSREMLWTQSSAHEQKSLHMNTEATPQLHYGYVWVPLAQQLGTTPSPS